MNVVKRFNCPGSTVLDVCCLARTLLWNKRIRRPGGVYKEKSSDDPHTRRSPEDLRRLLRGRRNVGASVGPGDTSVLVTLYSIGASIVASIGASIGPGDTSVVVTYFSVLLQSLHLFSFSTAHI